MQNSKEFKWVSAFSVCTHTNEAIRKDTKPFTQTLILTLTFPYKPSRANSYKFASTIPRWKLLQLSNDRCIFNFKVNDISIPLHNLLSPGFLSLTTWESRSIHSDFGSNYTGEIINSLHSQTLRISSKTIHTSQRPAFVYKHNTHNGLQQAVCGVSWAGERVRPQVNQGCYQLCHTISHSLCLYCWYAHDDRAGKPTASGSFREVMWLIGVFCSREAVLISARQQRPNM